MSVTAAFYCAMIPRVSIMPQPIKHCARAGRQFLTATRGEGSLNYQPVMVGQRFKTTALPCWYKPAANPLISCNLATAGTDCPQAFLSSPLSRTHTTRCNAFRPQIRGDHSLAQATSPRTHDLEARLRVAVPPHNGLLTCCVRMIGACGPGGRLGGNAGSCLRADHKAAPRADPVGLP